VLISTGRGPANTDGTVRGIGFAVVVWLLPAAGTVVTAVLTGRGSNPARIVLASLMGLFAVAGLCGGAVAVAGAPASAAQTYSGVMAIGLAVLAATIGVLLILPAANRYFSAGPGRRFAPATPESVP
jgi:hypothetical protein